MLINFDISHLMRKIYFLLTSFLLITGCAQNLALLGPAVSIATTGGIQHAVVGGTINHGIKKETGKDSNDKSSIKSLDLLSSMNYDSSKSSKSPKHILSTISLSLYSFIRDSK